MARAQVLADAHVISQRQITGGRCNAVAPDNHCPVVKRCVVFKNINQQLAGDQAVDFDSRPLYLLKGRTTLNHHQGACLYLGHLKSGPYQLVDSLIVKALVILALVKRKEIGHVIAASQLFQSLAKLRLEYNQKGRHRNGRGILQNPQYGSQMKHGGKQHKHQDNQKSF